MGRRFIFHQDRGFTLIEVLTVVSIAAIMSIAGASVVSYWRQETQKATNGAQVRFIEQSLKQYVRTHTALPDLSDTADIGRWLAIYTPPGSPSLANGQPRVMPEGVSYQRTSNYRPSEIAYGQVSGQVTLGGTGCDQFDSQNSCLLTIVP